MAAEFKTFEKTFTNKFLDVVGCLDLSAVSDVVASFVGSPDETTA